MVIRCYEAAETLRGNRSKIETTAVRLLCRRLRRRQLLRIRILNARGRGMTFVGEKGSRVVSLSVCFLLRLCHVVALSRLARRRLAGHQH